MSFPKIRLVCPSRSPSRSPSPSKGFPKEGRLLEENGVSCGADSTSPPCAAALDIVFRGSSGVSQKMKKSSSQSDAMLAKSTGRKSNSRQYYSMDLP
ncbi:hypothetical protein CEXT_747581 [Caerostris extrusa]|uniref:Uncharacterized protein n=1 Tax=Caerostris extrusa TaxID=172846 RepID=A0AAV4T8X2_CAEEX|nr:hypothetical protein CEXT_747581 [Caerostris extrusa]